MIDFKQVDKYLSALLKEFGPRRRSIHPEYPFWRLKNDGLWELSIAATGIELETTGTGKSIGNPDFRNRVLRAYEYRCAICGFDVRLGDRLVAVEAGHIKWHQAGGPETEKQRACTVLRAPQAL